MIQISKSKPKKISILCTFKLPFSFSVVSHIWKKKKIEAKKPGRRSRFSKEERYITFRARNSRATIPLKTGFWRCTLPSIPWESGTRHPARRRGLSDTPIGGRTEERIQLRQFFKNYLCSVIYWNEHNAGYYSLNPFLFIRGFSCPRLFRPCYL
jgi:hypothetical protein